VKRLLGATLALFAAFAAASSAAEPNAYVVHNLASNVPGLAANTNPDVVNAWGLDASATSPWWIADNGTDLSTVHLPTGAALALRPTVAGGPTGLVANTTSSSFPVNGARASFLFSSEDGVIRAWRGGMTEAAAVADRSGAGAIYKGLAIAATPDRLYATDFHNGRVDVFDASFKLISTSGGFKDAKVAKGFAPFGIQALGGNIFVTYAKQDAAGKDDVAVPGQAYVDEFTPDGQLVARVVNSGKKNAPLNAPWGLALAPSDFSVFSGDLLVGNFGNGRISAYTKRGATWVYKGQLRLATGTPVTIDGLWAIAFGNGSAAGPTNTLYFLAGPSDEKHGLFGSITTG
jgi:uncharacterized protein (TIGR03118 family)